MPQNSNAERSTIQPGWARTLTDMIDDTLLEMRNLDSGADPSLHLLEVKFAPVRREALAQPLYRSAVYSAHQLVEQTVERGEGIMDLFCESVAPGCHLPAASPIRPTVFWVVDCPDGQQFDASMYKAPQVLALVFVPASQRTNFRSFIRRETVISKMMSGAGLGRSLEVLDVENSEAGIASAVDRFLRFAGTDEAILLPFEAQGIFIVNDPNE